GGEVANAALSLGMKAIGFDPQLTVQRAWQLSSGIKQATTLDHLFSQSSFVTLHVPLNDATRNLVNAERLALMKPGGILLNFARGGIVDDDAVLQALDSGHLAAYVSDFPNNKIRNHPRVTALPHLGASTGEAEENCAAMVADNLREFLENGNIRHSVNFPEAVMPRTEGQRITISNLNVPNMVGQISTRLAEAGVNIVDLLNKSRGEIAYTLVDVEGEAPEATLQQVAGIKGVLNMRVI
ncbi:MAG: phosphoglycerate dehydrogenase, partial [Gammaproteobacteria bacterium]